MGSRDGSLSDEVQPPPRHRLWPQRAGRSRVRKGQTGVWFRTRRGGNSPETDRGIKKVICPFVH